MIGWTCFYFSCVVFNLCMLFKNFHKVIIHFTVFVRIFCFTYLALAMPISALRKNFKAVEQNPSLEML